jgi:hypothetical protein
MHHRTAFGAFAGCLTALLPPGMHGAFVICRAALGYELRLFAQHCKRVAVCWSVAFRIFDEALCRRSLDILLAAIYSSLL